MINRRQFAIGVGVSAAAASLTACTSRSTTSDSPHSSVQPAPPASFGELRQIDAGLLNVGYVEQGPANGRPVVLLHGWPYDIHSYVDVAPILAARGYRVFVPYLRGYGTTRFLSAATFRNAQQSAVAVDVVDFMDAVGIPSAMIGGFDWGARTAAIVAAIWPQRVQGLVSVSGYLITNLPANQQPLAPEAELGWWYQYYLATERGVRGYRQNTRDFNKLIWRNGSPQWNFDDATYQRTAAAFDNPDHVDIVVHNYRWRLSLAQGEERYDELESKLAVKPTISVPTVTVGSDFDGQAKDGKSYRQMFTGRYSHKVLNGVGHNVPQEAPKDFADAIIEATPT